ncbi:hypothetical protein CRG98_001745 [Punica granatum]|uniref:Uncharacterized protein n=1 Tax=Punica granatum TaxID=22663 RepID=A0A2I0LAZ7_PUNGR|nr:hypothetical protein CRG98_001745 [Punica granatum]
MSPLQTSPRDLNSSTTLHQTKSCTTRRGRRPDLLALSPDHNSMTSAPRRPNPGVIRCAYSHAPNGFPYSHTLSHLSTQTLSGEAQKLAQENAKLQYRIEHLVRAIKEADRRLEG